MIVATFFTEGSGDCSGLVSDFNQDGKLLSEDKL